MKFIAVYLCWLFTHIMFYVINSEYKYPRDVEVIFLPFSDVAKGYRNADSLYDYLWYYDITELIVYSSVPLLMAILYIAFKPSKK